MKKQLFLLLILALVGLNVNAQQCLSTTGCSNFVKEYPSSGAPYTPTSSWQVLSNPATGSAALMNGGNWTRFNVVSGNTYEWTYCESFGGVSTSWDPQLTLYNNANTTTQLCFSTDVCGTNGLAPYISWTANFTGVVRVLSTAYVSGVGGCQSNSGAANKLAYRMIPAVVCTTPGTPLNVTGTQTGQTTANLSWSAGSPLGSSTVTYYWVIGTSSSVVYNSGVAQGSTTGISASVSGLTAGTTYYLKVFANTSCNNTSSSYGNTASFTTTPAVVCTTPGTPASAIGTPTGQTTANLSWSAGSPTGSSTVTYYWVVGTSSSVTYGGSGVVAQGVTAGTSATTSALTCGTTYYLRVYAYTSCNGTSSAYKTSASFTTSACSSSILYGVDVSHYNGTINWQLVYAAGKSFAFAKCSEGVSGADDINFTTNMKNGKSAGVVMGAYHLARPYYNAAVDEANHFIGIAGSYIGAGQLPPALDLEPANVETLTKSVLSTWVQTWISTVQNATGVAPIIYTTHYDATNLLNSSLNIYKLWIANYPTSATTPPTNLGIWTTWAFDQYFAPSTASNDPATGMDLDVFNGDMTALNNLINATPSPTATITNVTFPSTVNNGTTFILGCAITATGSMNVIIGASLLRNGIYYDNASNDNLVSLSTGTNSKTRSFNLSVATPNPLPTGTYDVIVGLWNDVNGNGKIDNTIDVSLNSYTSNNKLTINTSSDVNEVSASDKIKIYPNPTTGKLEISEIETLGNECKVEIINNLGSLIYISVYKNFGNKISLDLSPYTEGLYLIRLSSNEVSYQKKVIKK